MLRLSQVGVGEIGVAQPRAAEMGALCLHLGELPLAQLGPAQIGRREVGLDEGRASYAIRRFVETVIAPSRLGFLLRDAEKLERNLELAAQSTRSHDETWEQPWGESRFVRDRHNDLRVTFAETLKSKRRFDVVFRVFDDGVGFRYVFPDQPRLKDVVIDDELTEFDVAPPATAWWIPAGEWNRYEYLYNRTPLVEMTDDRR